MLRIKVCGLLASASIAALATASHAQTAAGGPDVDTLSEVVVTAQRRSEALQSVPIAVSAFSGGDLKAQRFDSVQSLQLSVPNFSVSQGGYGTSNFKIRGIGYQLVSSAADAGVSIHINGAPVDRSRIAESQFYDIERVEVLRGPQGTLYGRNATGGVLNQITAKPKDAFEGALTGEYGNYDTYKLSGMVNIPVSDALSVRLAGIVYKHDGFQENVLLGTRPDAQDLYSTRLTVGFRPSERLRGNLMWEHFQEKDSYNANAKVVCAQDPGPTSIGGVSVNSAAARAYLSRGCLPTPLTDAATQTGTPNSGAVSGGQLAGMLGFATGNVNAGAVQPNDPFGVRQSRDPFQKARNDNFQLSLDFDVSDALTLSSLTQYTEDHVRQGSGGSPAAIAFNVTSRTPGGAANDPQIGASPYLTTMTYNNLWTRQWSQELRLQSSFEGPLNFSVGGLYLHINRGSDVFIMNNGTTLYVSAAVPSAYIDPNPVPDGSGHNYYYASSPYQLESKALFGEVYWKVTDTVRVTAGLRYTDDAKSALYQPLAYLTPGKGPNPNTFMQKAEWKETTGRLNVDWQPELSFTDKTLVYASYARGYKGGGFNTPDVTSQSATTYDPEFVNAYEIGAKNSLFGHKLTLNLTGFIYDYSNYQFSYSRGFSVGTTNINTTIKGVELESIWRPVRNLTINANAGYIQTKVGSGSSELSIDSADPTGGDPNFTLLRSVGNVCVGNTAGVAALLASINAGQRSASTLLQACPTAANPQGPYTALGLFTSQGVPQSIAGNELPGTPHWNVAIGIQYRLVFNEWDVTPRVDYHYQSRSYGDIFNRAWNVVPDWSNVNASITFAAPNANLDVQVYAKNLFDSQPITAASFNGPSVGGTRTVYYLDPRTYGVSLTKRF